MLGYIELHYKEDALHDSTNATGLKKRVIKINMHGEDDDDNGDDNKKMITTTIICRCA